MGGHALRSIRIRVHHGEQSGYVAESVDLPVVSQGSTIDEALANIREAIALHLEDEDAAARSTATALPCWVVSEAQLEEWAELVPAAFPGYLLEHGGDAGRVVFEVVQESDGGFVAQGLTEDIFTEASTWEDLRENVREAVRAYHFDSSPPRRIRLHLVRDEMFTLA